MVWAFTRHLLGYFKKRPPNEDTDKRRTKRSVKRTRSGNKKSVVCKGPDTTSKEVYVPVIEGDGEVVAYRKLSPMNEKSNNPSKIKLNVPPPLIHKNTSLQKPRQHVSTDADMVLDQKSAKRLRTLDPVESDGSDTQLGSEEDSENTPSTSEFSEWDYWPDGDFERLFSNKELKAMSKNGEIGVPVHWACRTSGSKNHSGTKSAERWQDGYISRRVCLGVITCTNPDCKIIVRPAIALANRKRQLEAKCVLCKSSLQHSSIPRCPAVQVLYCFKGGIYFIHKNTHNHVRPTYILHLTATEEAQFRDLVEQHPKSGPLQLLVGPPTLSGPGRSAADISAALVNKDRISYERKKVKAQYIQTNPTGDTINVQAFASFCEDNEDFIVQSVIGKTTVISMQNPVLVSELVRASHITDEAVNGILTDAAHGYWKAHNNLLIVSSVYSPLLHCWVPGLLSYANGATEKHYSLHFQALFRIIAQEHEQTGLHTSDDAIFGNVVDFSQAERNGFIDAFVAFKTSQRDPRTATELRTTAASLLKGCRQHFETGITRIVRIGGVIPQEERGAFRKLASGLVTSPDLGHFQGLATEMLHRFPLIQPWLSWWLRDEHASMIFQSHMRMDPLLWDSMPDSTNAEESMHWRLYRAVEKKHDLMEGIYGVQAFLGHFERRMVAEQVGIPTQYGVHEPWKLVAQAHGRTKPFRPPRGASPEIIDTPLPATKRKTQERTINDGRPPDTAKALLKSGPNRHFKNADNITTQSVTQSLSLEVKNLPAQPTKTRKEKKIRPQPQLSATIGHLMPSYKWENNSCWLDTSLELLWNALLPDFKGFSSCFSSVPTDDIRQQPLYSLFRLLQFRKDLYISESENHTVAVLTTQRNTFREDLVTGGVISAHGLTGFDAVLPWYGNTVLKSEVYAAPEVYAKARSYLLGYSLDFRSCLGDKTLETPLPHHDITRQLTPRSGFQVGELESQMHGGKLQSWLRSLTGVTTRHLQSSETCWHNTEDYVNKDQGRSTVQRCTGEHCTSLFAYLSLPVILSIEMNDGVEWDIPEKLVLLPKHGNQAAVVYQLSSRVFFRNNHFISRHARSVSGRKARQVFAYDDMQHGGTSVLLPGSKVSSHLAGPHNTLVPSLPEGFKTHIVVYNLVGGRDSQTRFYSHQLSALQKNHPIIRISSNDIDNISLATLYLEDDSLAVLPEDDRLWFAPDSLKQRMAKIDYHTLSPTAPPLSMPSARARRQFPPSPTTSSSSSSSSYVSCGRSSDDVSVLSNVSVRDDTNSTTKHTSRIPSPHPVRCRCGAQGDGNLMCDALDTVLCAICNEYSHIACQRHGRANHIPLGEDFDCSDCLGEDDGLPGVRTRLDFDRLRRTRTLRLRSLPYRLEPAKGVLVRIGEFWYPARMLQLEQPNQPRQWRVRMWRGCTYADPQEAPKNLDIVVEEGRIVDELWQDRTARRKIRLGQWTRSFDLGDGDEVLTNPKSYPYTQAIDSTLRPHLETLSDLLNWEPGDLTHLSSDRVPVLKYLEKARTSSISAERVGVVPFIGDLDFATRAQIHNWIFESVPGAKGTFHQWVGRYVVAHAVTLFLVDRLRSEDQPEDEKELLARAWRVQLRAEDMGDRHEAVDVDLECLGDFERRIFECSADAGEAGFEQWGLDAGDHQGAWNPYHGLPGDWEDGWRPEDAEEILERGPAFVTVERRPQVVEPQKRKGGKVVHPRPRKRSKAKQDKC